MATQLNNSLTVDIIDRFGKLIDKRDYVNIVYPEISSAPIAVIDWSTQCDTKLNISDIVSPVIHNGIEFHGDFAWGSAVKRGQSIGLTSDFGLDYGFIKSTEDGQRVQRWLIAQGINGGFKADSLKVKIVKPGKMFKGHLCEDGFGYISSRYKEYVSGDLVSLGRARETYSFWQRIGFSEKLWDEFAPAVDDLVHDLANPTSMLMDYSHSSFDEKKALAALDLEMVQHPFVANALARSCADMYFRASTSLPAKGEFKVAAPTSSPTVVYTGHHGKVIVARYPIDSNSSIQAIELSTSKGEEERIANLEIIQYSIHSDQLFAKGCMGIVDDLGEYDLIICSEDIKMGKEEVKDLRCLSEIELTNVIIPFTTVYAAGSACGVNAAWAKDLLGLDHDGDMPVLIDCNKLPVLWQSVKDLKPGKTPKLPKSKTPITETSRAEMISKSMSNLVGFASNVASMSFVVEDRQTLAERLGFKSEESLNDELNFFIKAGTDGFKTSIDLVKIEKQVAILQNNLQGLVGGAPWCLWNRSEVAFRRMVPPFAYVDSDGHYCYEDGRPMEVDVVKLAVKPYMDGTIAQITKRILPNIQQLLDTPIKTQPLTAFRPWALKVSDNDYACAQAIVKFHNSRVKRVNWYDPESIASYKTVLKREVETWLKREGIDRKMAACALWQVTHSSRSLDSGASCVFLAFPEEVKWIIENKPGLSGAFKTVITGLNFQLPGITELSIDVDVVDVEVIKGGKKIIRKAVVAEVDGQKQPAPSYPKNMIAMVAINTDQPRCGRYHARIEQTSSGAWVCQLV